MLTVSWAAISKLKALVSEHPEDPVVRVTMKDVGEHRLSFTITLVSELEAHDQVQVIDGLTVAIEGPTAPRMAGVTLDFHEARGFRFLHPEEPPDIRLTEPNLN